MLELLPFMAGALPTNLFLTHALSAMLETLLFMAGALPTTLFLAQSCWNPYYL
jgi:hypothetical protein